VLEGATVLEVVESKAESLHTGDIVLGYTGWQEYAVVPAKVVRKLDPSLAPAALGVLGMPGLTGYTGLLNIGHPKAGETVVVAAAAGAAGSVVSQIAKIKECRAVGVAGGKEKCDFVREKLGFDARLDHRSATFTPKGIDIYFENVAVLAAVLADEPVRTRDGLRDDRALQRHWAAGGSGSRSVVDGRHPHEAPDLPRIYR
jgi:NADPH-dependent curcumin reductase CurA